MSASNLVKRKTPSLKQMIAKLFCSIALISSLTMTLLLSSANASALDSQSTVTQPDPIRTWNEIAFGVVRTTNASDAQAARLYAMVNVAIYDAVNGIDSQLSFFDRDFALVSSNRAPFLGNRVAAAVSAAHAVMVRLYPNLQAQFDTQLAQDLAQFPRRTAGQTWGASVGAQVVEARLNDGSTPNEIQSAGSGPGQFRAPWSGVQFRNLAPFAIEDSAAYVSSGPAPLDSVHYAAAFNEVKTLGNSAILDTNATEIFRFWSGGANTVQPAGEWLKIALVVAANRNLSLSKQARLFALLSIALSDTVAPTFRTKFNFHAWRPGTAIREADTDGNPNTEAYPSWTPRAGGVGTSPEHTSGHSSFSAAAAEILEGFFCDDDIS